MSDSATLSRFPLSPEQRAAWRSRYGRTMAGCRIAIEGTLDRKRLARALAAIVDSHEILRTRFEMQDGLDLPVQAVEPPGASALSWDLHSTSNTHHELEVQTSCLNADATTFSLLAEELALLYARPVVPAHAPIQYADWAAWATERRGDAESAAKRAYWDAALGSMPRVDAATDVRSIESTLATPAAETPEMPGALAAWLALWSARGTEQWIGVRFDGRPETALSGVYGPMERWLPIDARLREDATIEAATEDVGARIAEMSAHQDYWPDSDPLLTTVGFAYSRWPAVRAAGVAWRVTETWRACEACPLTLTVIAGDGATRVQVAYDPARWRPADAARLLAQYTALVARGASAATTPRRDWIVGPRPPSPPPAPAAADVLARLSAYAAAQPAQVAVTCAGRAWTYATLTAHAAALAALVRPAGPEARIGLVLERSVEAVAAWLGLLAAGVVAVPLDPAAPPARLAALGAQCRLQAVVTSRALAPTLPAALGPPLLVDAAPAGAGPAPLHGPAPARLAYLLFTSGSTGTPKGVAVSHGALAHYAAALTARLAPPAGATWALVSPLTADLGYTSLLGALTTGGTLCWSTADEATDPGALAAADYLKITPTHLAALLRAATPPARVLPRRALLLGGEALSWALTEQLAALAPALPVVNHYGPTETTIGVLMGPAPPEPAPRPATPPLGTPLPHVAAYLLDATLAPVLDGAPGTLWIGGPALARGYDHAPALTAARFRPDPFAAAGARMYDTGDRARRTADGALEFLGRTDRQLKLRGHRIEPAEVEAVLRTHPAVAHAVVLPTPPDAPAALAAYLVATGERRPPLHDMRRFLDERLPAHLVPSHVLWIPEVPLTANGKLDVSRLPRAESATAADGGLFAPPQTEVEQMLAGIWSSVLKRDRVDVHDNFFLSGGDSIASIQVVARASQLGLHITPKQLFDHPTIRELAAVAQAAGRQPAAEEAVPGPVPLTPIQHWFFDQSAPEPHHYNQAIWLDARGTLDAGAVSAALQALVQHHDALRLRFIPSLDGWRQVQVAREDQVPLDVVEIAKQGDAARAAVEREAARLQASLNLVNGPLWRAAVFRFGDRQPDRLLLIAHHLVVDGVSWNFLLEDLQRAYLQTLAAAPIDLAARTTPFQRWAEYLARLAGELAGTRERDEWLAPRRAAVSEPPARVASPGSTEHRATLHAALTGDETTQLLDTGRAAYGLQAHELLLAALLDAYANWSGRSDLLVDVESHGRAGPSGAPDVSRTVGWFTTRFPLLLERRAAAAPGEVLKSVKEQVRRVSERGLNYGLLRYVAGHAGLASDLEGMPQPAVSFNYFGQVQRLFPAGSPFVGFHEEHGSSRAASTPTRFRLDLNATIDDGRLQTAWAFNPQWDDRRSIEKLVAEFRAAIGRFVAHCSTPGTGAFTPSDFPAAHLSQHDLDRLLDDWSREFS